MLYSFSLRLPREGFLSVHYRSSSDSTVLSHTPLVPANHKDQNYGVEKVGKDRIKSP